MPDETTSNPAPVDTAIPQAPETPISTPSEAFIAPAPVEVPTEPIPTPEPTPEPSSVDINQLLGASGEASCIQDASLLTQTRIEASPQAPLAENINSQTFTKSMRELFTKALNARQNKKRKKLDRIMTLFAKQTMITNNEVEKLLHVSDSTATRYLATLEKEGKLKQNAKKGHATSYSKI